MTSNEAKERFDFFIDKYMGAYFTPEQFDIAMQSANMDLFQERIGVPELYRGDEAPPVAYDRTRRIMDSMLPFKKEVLIQLTNGKGPVQPDYQYTDTFRIRYYINPADCAKPVPLDPKGVLRYRSVNILSEKEWADRTSSSIDFPTYKYPVVRFVSPLQIELLPTTIQRVEHIYLSKPKPFHWAYTTVNNRPVWNPLDPTDQGLQWLEIDCNQVLMRALSFAGINVKDGELIQYAEMKQKEGV